MIASVSVFLDLTPPSAATCFYVTAILAVALFFKFNRVLSVRNLDVLTLFVLMPGLLKLVEATGGAREAVGAAGGVTAVAGLLVVESNSRWWGYLLLLCGSGLLLARSLFDLVLERRPALAPNLNLGGLLWLAGALFVGLLLAPVRTPAAPPGGASQTPIDAGQKGVQKGAESLFKDVQTPVPPSEVGRWVERGLTLLCHLSIVTGLVLIGWRHFDDLHAGTAAATFYLLLPYAYLLLPLGLLGAGRWDHAWPMALMIWSVMAYRRPILAGAFLGAAAGSSLFPLVTLPVWLSFYRGGRGAGRFAGSFALAAGLCLAIIGLVLAVNEGGWPYHIPPMWTQPTWLPWYESPKDMPSFWVGIHWAYRIPVFIAYIAFVIATLFWPAPKNLAHVLALTAAHLIGIQFWYPDQGGVYVLWYLPFLLLLVFRPNLSACQPPLVASDDWLARRRQALVRLARKVFRRREPAPVG
jgi:hypothetical protein